MIIEMLLPKMGESITEGTILKWLKKPGDQLQKDEIILEISTDKVDSEIPTPAPGILKSILVQEGETVAVGTPIALIETQQQEALPQATTEHTNTTTVANQPTPLQTPEKEKSKINTKRFYSPVVKKIAQEHHLSLQELESIPGSGLNGRLTKKDLLNYLNRQEAPQPVGPFLPAEKGASFPQEKVQIIPMDNMRKTIAKHMVDSIHTSAHVALYTEVNMHAIEQIRQKNKKSFKEREGFSLTYLPFIVQAVVKGLKAFPYLNASIEDDNILLKSYYNIGIAVAVENGLLVPNIFNADEKNVVGIARAIHALAQKAREKKLLPDDLQNGTFSISNFGVFGTTLGFPIINQPQVAILGVGAVKKRPIVIENAIAIRPIIYLSLTIDHRLIDGAMGSQFLEFVRQELEDFPVNMEL